MRKIFFTLTCLGTFIYYSTYVSAQTNSAGQDRTGAYTITTGVPFLLIGPDSRSGAIGEAGVAIADDANAMHWNPSALAFSERQLGFAMSYSPWLRALNIPDINLIYLSGYYNLGEKGGAIGTSLRYFSLGEIQFTSPLGDPIGTDKPNEFAVDVAYARKITPVLSAAVSLRYIHSRLASNGNLSGALKPVNTVAGDISFLYSTDFDINSSAGALPLNFKAGINISNIGPKISYTEATTNTDFIPVNLRIGYAFKLQVDDYNSITFTNDFNKLLVPSVTEDDPNDPGGGRSTKPLLEGIFSSFGDAPDGFSGELSEINISAGFEYWYRQLFAARVGFFYEDPSRGNRKFLTLGAGLRYNVFGLHFSYLAPFQTNHPLQNTLRFTLTYDFAEGMNE